MSPLQIRDRRSSAELSFVAPGVPYGLLYDLPRIFENFGSLPHMMRDD